MIKQVIHDLFLGKHLSLKETKEVMAEIMDAKATPAQIAAFLTAIRL
ncbi:MAG: anthranilate phosphoribosyltransferase, partial [Elusimicrobiota bacterium]|nr:anthranilate phosphoribosyltransferase [Elusimicrobiota bacterium]